MRCALAFACFGIACASKSASQPTNHQPSQPESHAAGQKASASGDKIVITQADDFRIISNVVCTGRQKTLHFEKYSHTWQECELACRATDWCTFYEMICGSKCVLNDHCTSFDDSACHSYVGYVPDTNPALVEHLKVHSHSEKRIATVPIICCVLLMAGIYIAITCDRAGGAPSFASMSGLDEEGLEEIGLGALGALVGPTESSEEDQAKALAIKARRENYGVDTGDTDVDVTSYFGGVIGLLVVFGMSIWLTAMTFMPIAHQAEPRGFCGLVGKDHQPLGFDELFSPREIYFLDNGTLNVGLEAMPQQCWRILEEDEVKQESGPVCLHWCQQEFGNWPRPLCALISVFGPMYRVCFKTRVWNAVHLAPELLISSAGCFGLSLLYGLISFGLAWYNSRDNTAHTITAPSRDACRKDGPYDGKCLAVLGWQTASDDYTASRRSMIAASLSRLADPALDMNCMLAFWTHGQPYYALGMMVAIFGPNSNDPFQTRATEMFISSLERGFPVRGMYLTGKREGSYEGIWTLIIALHALTRRAYVGDAVAGTEFAAVALSALSSLLSQIPNAAVCRHLLFAEGQDVIHFDDFYGVEKHKQSLGGGRKYLPSLDALSFGVCVGLSFQSTFMLVYLYVVGVVVGMSWYIFFWLLYRRSHIPSVHEFLGFFLAFAFWFMAPTRLGGYPDVMDGLYEGTAPLNQCALRGCASLRPGNYYFIRITTLSLFWLFILKEYQGFFKIVWKSLWKGEGEIVVSILIVSGWMALVLELAIFWWHRNRFSMSLDNRNNKKPTNSTKRFRGGGNFFSNSVAAGTNNKSNSVAAG